MLTLSNQTRGLLTLGVLGICLLLEGQRPLREPTQPKPKQVLRNLSIASTAALLVRFAFYPVILHIAETVENKGWGILPHLRFPQIVERALGYFTITPRLHQTFLTGIPQKNIVIAVPSYSIPIRIASTNLISLSASLKGAY